LNKPDLRRETERECNLVANRQKTKDDIVGPILNKMKDCYTVATRDARKLDEAMARHFQRVGVGNDTIVLQANFSECGNCQRAMALKQERQNPRGRANDPRKMLFCNTCQEGYIMPHRGRLCPKTAEENTGAAVKCPICNFQVISIARGDGYEGNGYNLCPKCYADPPPEHGGTRNGGNFPCFSCSHPTCALAGGIQGGEVEVFSCPFCRERRVQGGKILLRKNTRGYVLSCANYSARQRCSFTIWLPRASQSITVDDNICSRCSTEGAVRKISFVWKPGGVPPHLGRESTVCILCDARFRQEVQIDMPQMNQVGSTSRQRNGNGNGHRRNATNSRNRSASSNGTNNQVCYRCNQPGHFANACPTRNQ